MCKPTLDRNFNIWQRGLSHNNMEIVLKFKRVGVYGSWWLSSSSLAMKLRQFKNPLCTELCTISDIEKIHVFSKQGSFCRATGYRQKAQNSDKLLI
jgi:hypothetical protein